MLQTTFNTQTFVHFLPLKTLNRCVVVAKMKTFSIWASPKDLINFNLYRMFYIEPKRMNERERMSLWKWFQFWNSLIFGTFAPKEFSFNACVIMYWITMRHKEWETEKEWALVNSGATMNLWCHSHMRNMECSSRFGCEIYVRYVAYKSNCNRHRIFFHVVKMVDASHSFGAPWKITNTLKIDACFYFHIFASRSLFRRLFLLQSHSV